MTFELDILDCNHTPETRKEEVQPVTTTMQPNTFFYLHLEASDDTAFDLVLSTESDNYSSSWPAKYGIVEQKVVDEPSQMWYYNEKTGGIHNAADPDYFLDNDYGWAMVANLKAASENVNAIFPKTPRKWYYDPVTSELTTEIEGVHSSLATLGQPRHWEYVQLAPSSSLKDKETAKWRIEYCFAGR